MPAKAQDAEPARGRTRRRPWSRRSRDVESASQPTAPAASRPERPSSPSTALATPSAGALARPTERVPVSLVERQTERARAQRRLLLRKIGIGVVVVALLVGLAWLVLGSPVLALRSEEIAIDGVGTTVTSEEVLAVVGPSVGVPLARVDADGLREELEAITTVRHADVARDWPHGLRIVIDAREPVAVVAADGAYALLDRDGVRIGTADAAPEGMPLVTVPLDSEATAPTLDAVLTVLGQLPEEQRSQVATAGAPNPRSITLVLHDGAEVRWGSAEESELKSAVLDVLRAQPARVYDLTIPRSPTTLQ